MEELAVPWYLSPGTLLRVGCFAYTLVNRLSYMGKGKYIFTVVPCESKEGP